MIKAAKYLNCTPFELLEKPLTWRRWAEQAMAAESIAAQNKKDHQEKNKGALGNVGNR